MRPLSRRFVLLGCASLVVVALLGFVGWQTYKVYDDLSAASNAAAGLQDAVAAGDQERLDRGLVRLQQHSSAASERTDGFTWSALEKLPIVGDDAVGVRVVSDVLADLSNNGIADLADTARGLDSITPSGGRIDLEAVAALADPVRAGRDAFVAAEDELATQQPTDFAGPLRTKFRDLSRQVIRAAGILENADTAVQVLPGMLGREGPRNYLLVFQNNAEIRATGGLPGAVSLLRADGGVLSMTRQVAANSFGEAERPVLELTAAEREIYDVQLGTYFLDANFTPDWPRASALMKARWEQVYDDRVDGVLTLDPVTISYLMEKMTPVSVGGVDLTADNVVDELLHQAYLRFPDPADQDAWFQEVSATVFDRVTQGGAGSAESLLRGLARGASEGRVRVHSFEETEQAALAGTPVAGDLSYEPGENPQVGVYLNDATGAKMSYFLRHKVEVRSTSCKDGVQTLSGKAYLLSDAPDDAASLPDYVTGAGIYGTEPGSQLVMVRLYGPVGGTVSGVRLNDEDIELFDVIEDQGRQVASIVAHLDPQFTVDLSWKMATGPGQSGDVQTTVTPGIEPGNKSSRSASQCAGR